MNFTRIKEKISYFRTHTFVRNAAVLQVGNIFGNVTQALIGIALARLLQPELFGIYALSFSLAGLLAIFLGVGAQDAVTTLLGGAYAANNKEQINDALAFLAKITMITSIVAFLGALSAPFIAQGLYGNWHVGIYAGIVVIASIISTTAYSFTMILLQVVGRIKHMMLLGLLDQLLRSTLALIFVIVGLKVFGIALGHLIGALVVCLASIMSWRSVKRSFEIIPSLRGLFGHIRHVSIKKYLGFSFWIAVDRNLSNLYTVLPVLLTGIFLLPGQVTYFKLAFGYINLALSFLGPIGTLLNVEFPKMKVGGTERLARNFTKVSFYSMGLSTVLTFGAIAVSSIAFKILYGEAFLPSITYVYGLGIYGVVMGFGIGLGSMVRALNKVTFSVKVHVANFLFWIPVGIFLIKSYGLWGTVIMTTGWYTVAILVNFFYLRRALNKMVA